MFKLSPENLIENLCVIPKLKKPERRSKGYKYLYKKMCLPVLRDPDTLINIDFNKFSMSELDELISCFHESEYKRMEKVEALSAIFKKCAPATRKTAFL